MGCPSFLRKLVCAPAISILAVLLAFLQGCAQSSKGVANNPPPTPTLAISTSSLPNGQVGTSYQGTLTATGGTTPYLWSLTSGALPAGLALNASTGAITGMPTTAVNAAPLTFTVTDSGTPAQNKSVNLTVTIAPSTLGIGTASLPNGQVGAAYRAALAATGGTAPYTWSLTSGTLPAGLTLNASTGAITGTPTTAVSATPLTFKVSDSSSPAQTQTANLTLTIASATLVITTSSLLNGQVGTAYSATLAASGGITPYTWSLTTGTLPAGLSLNPSTGAITGIPAAVANATPLAFKVTDSSTPALTQAANFTLTIAPATLVITTSSLPNGQVGVAYSARLAATGGTMPYTWSLTTGTLPAGLSLNPSTGAITGTPTAAANATPLTFKVSDSSTPALTQMANLTLTIAPATLVITTSSLPNGQVGTGYSATLSATGGTTPYSWSLNSGTLPAGLSLSASTGAIIGTPTAAVSATPLTFTVTDSSSPALSKSASLTLTVSSAPIVITTSSLPNGQVGSSYSTTLAATGGKTPYTWSITSGTLPAGLTLNASTGTITGTPTAAANATPLTFKVSDSSTPALTQTANLTLTIAPATLVITTSSLPNGQVGTAYSTTLAATGGKTPYTWSLTSGTLPTGLTLNASTGAITGTPTAVVNATPLTFKVSDSSSPALTQTANLTLTIAPATLAITTSSLPNGQVGTAYSATLAATGGTTPYTWSLTSGTLPAGLTLNASTGAITGTPTTAVNAAPLTFTVTDSGSPAQNRTVNVTLTISPSNITVSVSPKRAGLTITQTLSVTAITNDSAGVKWSASGSACTGNTCGTFSAASSATGVPVTYTAPTTAGVYTINATSATDGTKSAFLSVAVTDLAGVTTYHNNLSRDGTNTQEYALTTTTVSSSTFGKLFGCTIDAPAYAQPLWIPNLMIGGASHNVVFVATQHDTVYAFDADNPACVNVWGGPKSLLAVGETYVSYSDVSATEISPDIGITGTPVIDTSTSTLYVVTKSKNNGTTCTPTTSCHQRLHALSLIDGSERTGSPVAIDASISVPGTGDGSTSGNVPFDPLLENQRPGLALVNGVVYVSWASNNDVNPYHGWIIGFNKTSLARVATYNDSPNGRQGGIWMSGGAPAADSSNNLYVLTGNGDYDGITDFGDSFLKLSTSGGLSLLDWFTPFDQATLDSGDLDLGSGGAVVLVDLPASSPYQHLLIGGGKAGDGNSGEIYVVNRDNLGHIQSANNNQIVQSFPLNTSIFSTGAFWNYTLYMAGAGGTLQAFPLNQSTSQFTTSPGSQSTLSFGFPGATPSVSSTGSSSNGIVWAVDSSQYCTDQSPGCGPAVLHAYDAANLGTELWNSAQGTGNAAGNAVKFTVPTVANGKVYVGTRTELSVYGLLPN